MNRYYILLSVLTISLLYACSSVEPKKSGLAYFNNLETTLTDAYQFNFSADKKSLLYILHYDSLCSCNGKHMDLVRKIIGTRTDYTHVVILKNDVKGLLKNSINNKQVTFLTDSSNTLEKHGNLFLFDKVFLIDNGNYKNMFDLEYPDINDLKKVLNL